MTKKLIIEIMKQKASERAALRDLMFNDSSICSKNFGGRTKTEERVLNEIWDKVVNQIIALDKEIDTLFQKYVALDKREKANEQDSDSASN